MSHPFSDNSALTRLIKISQHIITDPDLTIELMQEVKSGTHGPMCSMYKALFKKNLLNSSIVLSELSSFFFQLHSIHEFQIFSSVKLGLSCFFMPKDSWFPLHDHPNKVVCTGVLMGKIRYMTLNKINEEKYSLSSKGTALTSDVMFGTEEYRNIHSLYAQEDSVILDIFMPNEEDKETGVYEVVRKRKREFELKKKWLCGEKRISV